MCCIVFCCHASNNFVQQFNRLKKKNNNTNYMYNHTNMERELITVGVEYALLQMGPQELEKVEACLASDYHCKIADCLEHPEYLKQVLSELFGNYYQDILDDVKQVVRGADADCHVEEFLTVLNTKQLVA